MFGFYTRIFTCQVENTLSFAFILRAFFEKSVEKNHPCLWEILWKTLQAFLHDYLKIWTILAKDSCSLCKTLTFGVKKKSQSEKKLVLKRFLSGFLIKMSSECQFFSNK